MNQETPSPKRITVRNTLSWVFGILFLIGGIGGLQNDSTSAMIMFIMAAIVLPPVNAWVLKQFNVQLSAGMKLLLLLAFMVVLGSYYQSNPSAVEYTREEQGAKPPAKSEDIKGAEVQEDPAIPREYKAALIKADMYANTMNMSKIKLYEQLTSEYGERFSPEAAKYAVENVKTDYDLNALKKARMYQETMNMSRASIHEQLTSDFGEGFTKKQADYALENLEK